MGTATTIKRVYCHATQGGIDETRLDSGPDAYADELARYIASPSTVRTRVLERFGYAPPLARIEQYRARHVELREAVRAMTAEPVDSDALDYTPAPRKITNPKEAFVQRELRAAANDAAAVPRLQVRKPPKSVKPTGVGKQVIDSVALDFFVRPHEITGGMRWPHLVDARCVVSLILRARGWSFPRIGRLLGGRDHSTIIHAVDMGDIYARRNPDFTPSLERNMALFCGEVAA